MSDCYYVRQDTTGHNGLPAKQWRRECLISKIYVKFKKQKYIVRSTTVVKSRLVERFPECQARRFPREFARNYRLQRHHSYTHTYRTRTTVAYYIVLTFGIIQPSFSTEVKYRKTESVRLRGLRFSARRTRLLNAF